MLIAIRNIIILVFCGCLISGTISAAPLSSSGELIALALHEETGRKIYLGAIYLPKGSARPQDLKQLSNPLMMEYRVVARRTSIRSLLGGMLLQSEVATGQAPDDATSRFADMILSNIKGSLYAGDSLVIATDQRGDSVASLNDQELARVDDTEVARYFLMGWISENGSTAVFRKDLMATEINPSLLSILEANRYSSERAAQVASWLEPDEAEEEQEVASAAAATDDDLAAQERSTAATGEAETELDPTVASSDSEGLSGSAGEPSAALVVTGAAEAQQAGLPADNLSGTGEDNPAAPPTPVAAAPQITDAVLDLGVQDYSRRLSEFHGQLVAMVYSKIRYPKRAVRRGLEGRLELDLTMENSGDLTDVTVSQSSGHSLLDKAAVKAARDAFVPGSLSSVDPVAIAEFGSDAQSMVIPIPVNFKLAQ